MTDKEYIEKKAQIRLLDLIPELLCMAELTEIGRTALKRLRNKYQEEIVKEDNSKN
jgi:hypothetical protein